MSFKSLKAHTTDAVQLFLVSLKFVKPPTTFLDGLLSLIVKLDSYEEESRALNPEIYIYLKKAKEDEIKDPFQIVPGASRVVLFEEELTINSFIRGLKFGAPFSSDGWTVYFEITPDYKKITCGIICSENSETTVSIKNQLLTSDTGFNSFMINSIGNRNILLSGFDVEELILSFSFKDEADPSSLPKLIGHIVAGIKEPDLRELSRGYLEKIISSAINSGHGNLIAVIEDDPAKIEDVKKHFTSGIYFAEPIDLCQKINQTMGKENVEANYQLKAYSGLLRNMINFDGITMLTDTGKIIGYNLLINSIGRAAVVGNARTRAYEALKDLKVFTACYFKSQDGPDKIS